jgi:AcrR family transcriptional regulator
MTGSATKETMQERGLVTRERLLEAAIRRFATVGYDAASTRQIEAEAGVKRGLIGYHFGDKETLWKTAAAWMFERSAAALQTTEENAANVEPVARLRYFVRAYVRFCARYPEVNRLMVREGMDDDWRLEWLVQHIIRPWYARVQALFDEAHRLGVGPAMGYPHFYYILTGAAALMFSMAPEAKLLAGIDTHDEAVISAHADALAELMFPSR